ncbi:hypothetical protein [Nocardiopsis sp. NPDC057823]|uniref:hypothetical protein n=1 Tax=Nocardiopsis sp. NPDC057823 TaxID=3346256 RepID=UPI00366AF182
MSIWSTVGPWDHDLLALDADRDDAAHYRAEGERDIHVGIATATSWHDNVSIRIHRDQRPNAPGKEIWAHLLLTPEATRELIGYLQQAVERVEATKEHRP